MGGIEATRRLLALCPAVAVIVLTMSDDDTSLLAAMRSGARGYLLKEADGNDVIAAIHTVMSGQVLFGQGVAASVLQLLDDPPARRDPPFKTLSNRELQILELVASGATNPSIARQLNISTKTVANMLSGILVKIEARDRAEATAKAHAAGLGARN